MSSDTINIAIADDHKLIRTGLVKIIQTQKAYNVYIEASDGTELLQMIEASDIIPDICILDIDMRPMNGYDTAKALMEKYPSVKILALSMYHEEFCIINMLKNGARAFMTKDTDPGILLAGIKQLEEEGYYYSGLPPITVGRVLQGTINPDHLLTEKELRFLALSCSEMSYKEIAKQMNVAERTVEGYRDNLFKKLNIKTRSGLVMFAMLTGLKTESPSS